MSKKPASPSTKHDIFDKVASRQYRLPFASVTIFACVWVINFGRTFFVVIKLLHGHHIKQHFYHK